MYLWNIILCSSLILHLRFPIKFKPVNYEIKIKTIILGSWRVQNTPKRRRLPDRAFLMSSNICSKAKVLHDKTVCESRTWSSPGEEGLDMSIRTKAPSANVPFVKPFRVLLLFFSSSQQGYPLSIVIQACFLLRLNLNYAFIEILMVHLKWKHNSPINVS